MTQDLGALSALCVNVYCSQVIHVAYISPALSFNVKMPKKYALVKWLEDESMGVMPLSAAKVGAADLFAGMKTKMKWNGKKWYDVQILKISGSFSLRALYMAN